MKDKDTRAYVAYLQANYDVAFFNGKVPDDPRCVCIFQQNTHMFPHDMLYTCPDTSVWVRKDIQESQHTQ